ncbi:MAG TPA: VOC family protein [Euzebya sp.]|nr:VOC family protein [Euzebya sp.]
MSLSLGNVTLDCAHPPTVAAFWSAALDRPIDEGASEFFVSIGRDDPSRPGMFLIKVPEPRAGKNRMHLDLHASDRELEVKRLLGLGATHHSDHEEFGIRWTTLLDVEGNEFCVAAG